MKMTAEEWVKEYEQQYADGHRTKSELLTAYLGVAGEFDAEPVLLSMDAAYRGELSAFCQSLPDEAEFYVFGASAADRARHYLGLKRLHQTLHAGRS